MGFLCSQFKWEKFVRQIAKVWNDQFQLIILSFFQENSHATIKLNETAPDWKETTPSVGNVVHDICSLVYISHVIWFCIVNFRVNLFTGTIVPQLMDIYPDDNEKGNETKILILRSLTLTLSGSSDKLSFSEKKTKPTLMGIITKVHVKVLRMYFRPI